jgi:hypothetical protein
MSPYGACERRLCTVSKNPRTVEAKNEPDLVHLSAPFQNIPDLSLSIQGWQPIAAHCESARSVMRGPQSRSGAIAVA